MPCGLVVKYESFGKPCCLHQQDQLCNMSQRVPPKRQYPPTRRQNLWMLCNNLKFFTDELLWGVLYDEEIVCYKVPNKKRSTYTFITIKCHNYSNMFRLAVYL